MKHPTDGHAVVRRYYLYRATATVGFITPIFTIFLLRDLSFAQLGTLSGLFSALLVLGEIPTGYVGDRIGLRNSLILGAGFKAASLLGFVVAESFAGYLVLYVLWAAGLTFDSGAMSAWLYETLAAQAVAAPGQAVAEEGGVHNAAEEDPADEGDRGSEEDSSTEGASGAVVDSATEGANGDEADLDEAAFTRVRGRGESINRWTGAATMVAGGLLYAVDPRLPFLAAAGWVLVGIPVLLTMPQTGAGLDQTPIREVVGVLRAAFTSPPLRSVVAFTALAFGSLSAAQLYVQPIAVDLLSGVGALSGVAPEATLGFLYAAFTVVAAIASYNADRVEQALGRGRTLVLLPVAVAVAMLVPLAVPLLALPVFFAMRSADPILRPITHAILNEELGSTGRATAISAASMVYGLVRLPLAVGGGVLADATSPIVAVAAFGGIFLVCGTAILLVESPASVVDADWGQREVA